MKDIRNYSLKVHNTFAIDARCDRFLEFSTPEEARQVAAILRQSATHYIIIGAGSNLLLTADFSGTVVHSAITGITNIDDNGVTAGSGEPWDNVVAASVAKGFYDLANLSAIPGDTGAAVVQNIGAYGAEISQCVKEIKAIEIASGEEVTIAPAECFYGYRDSRFKHEWKNRYLITAATFTLNRAKRPTLEYGNIRSELEKRNISMPTPTQLRDVITDIRHEKLPDPKITGNAGSFFMNPVVERSRYDEMAKLYPGMPHYRVDEEHEKIPAAWLIDQCGWKGRSMGRAGVHDRQALVLVNRGGATGSEIVDLCRAIQRDVHEKFNIDIKPEVNII